MKINAFNNFAFVLAYFHTDIWTLQLVNYIWLYINFQLLHYIQNKKLDGIGQDGNTGIFYIFSKIWLNIKYYHESKKN